MKRCRDTHQRMYPWAHPKCDNASGRYLMTLRKKVVNQIIQHRNCTEQVQQPIT